MIWDAREHASVVSFLATCAIVLGSYAIVLVIRSLVLRPASQRRALLQQGVDIGPYRPIAGDLLDFKRMEAHAQLSPLPSPAHHHLLFPYLFPFLHHRISHLTGPAHGGTSFPPPFAFWVANQPTIVLTDPEDVKMVVASDVKHLQKPAIVYHLLKPLLGRHGILFVEGETWHAQRSILRPAFFTEKLKEMVADMAASALEMVEAWSKHVSNNDGKPTELEIAKDLKEVTADILARTSFGSSYLKGRSVFDKQVELLDVLMKVANKLSIIPGYRFIPTESNRKLWELEKAVNHDLHEIVESRRRSLHETGISEASGTDLLGMILHAEEQEVKQGNRTIRLSTQEVIDQCKTFFFAGHETTATLLAWTMVLLSLNKDWQEKAREEVLEICGKGGALTADQLNRMKIVGMVLNETLRLYPPFPEYRRCIVCPDKGSFKLGHRTLPDGTTITVSSLYLHRRKDLWGEDADEFNPERFANGVAKACRHPQGFMPFWQGPRICIGQHFAVMEAKVVLALILKRFRFSLSHNYRHAPVVGVSMQPKHGVQVILEQLH